MKNFSLPSGNPLNRIHQPFARRILNALVLGSCLLSGSLLSQTIANIDITDNPVLSDPSANHLKGVVGKSGNVTWNAIRNTNLYSNLADESGVNRSISFQLTGNLVNSAVEADKQNTFRIGSSEPGFFQSHAYLTNTGNPGNSDTSGFKVGGLTSGSPADLYLYSTWAFGGGAEFRLSSDGGATWTAWKLADGSPSSGSAAFFAGHSFVVFSGVKAHSDGTILGEWKTTLNGGSTRNRGVFNAAQIVAHAPLATSPVSKSLAFDAAGDLFLNLRSLTFGKTSVVQESIDLSSGSWTDRFSFTGISNTELIISHDKPSRFFRIETVAAPKVVQPNVVMILAEDCSKHWFDLYDPTYGTSTPNIDMLAGSGIVFENAFCNVAVCSAARSTLMSGSDPSRIGIQWHRRISQVSLSNGQLAFPAYLRKAGYFTTNSTKTDYNLDVGESWDNVSAGEFGWRERPDDTSPFFHVRTIYTSHESSIRTASSIASPTTDPTSVNLYPIHPDTEIFRRTFATYVDKIRLSVRFVRVLE